MEGSDGDGLVLVVAISDLSVGQDLQGLHTVSKESWKGGWCCWGEDGTEGLVVLNNTSKVKYNDDPLEVIDLDKTNHIRYDIMLNPTGHHIAEIR